MENKKIEGLIVKFISRSITEPELDDLSTWLEEPKNERLFQQFIHLNYALDYNLLNFDADKTKLILHNRMETDTSSGLKLKAFYRYAVAAAVAVLVTTAIFFFKKESPAQIPNVVQIEKPIPPGTDKAILTLEDGSHVTLEKGQKFQTQKLKSEGERLVYLSSDENEETLVYNYLTIPRGGQYFIQLSDGTQVWLNSESKLKYPVAFAEKQDRMVELVYGEAYFDVSPSTEHEGAAFKVMTKTQSLEVLGTELNLKAYKDDNKIYTTLVEGKIAVGNGIMSETLTPGQQSIVSISNESLSVQQVDVDTEVAWRHGYFMFNQMNLEEMMEQLSRWYDFEPNFENQDKKAMTFSGRLNRSENLNELLDYIQATGIVKFSNENGVLTIK